MQRLIRLCTMLAALTLASAAAAAGIPGKIALVGPDHQVYLADPNGGAPRPLTRGDAGQKASIDSTIERAGFGPAQHAPRPVAEQRFSWPTWSPDGATLLVLGVRLAPGGAPEQAGIYKVDLVRPGVIAPVYENLRRSPIYTFFGPSGREFLALVGGERGLGLGLIRLSDNDFRPLGLGFPFYFSWRADGEAVVTHVGGASREEHVAEVNLIDLAPVHHDGKPAIRLLSDKPALFRAPAWSPDGSQVAYAVEGPKGSGASLTLRSKDGKERTLATIAGRSVFSWTPQADALTLAEASSPDGLFFGGINLIHVSDGHRETLFAGNLGAFFWAPDGGRVLVATPEFDSGEWRWQVVERATKNVREAGHFFPTPEFQFLAPHFDQFAMSHRFWAPDSRHFVYFGYPTTARDESQAVPATIWVGDSKTGKVARLADGRAAFWSPR